MNYDMQPIVDIMDNAINKLKNMKKQRGGQKKEDPKVQRTIMIDSIVDRIIETEAEKTKRSFSHVLNKALRKTYKLS